jgi:hypothetical protein
LVVYDEVRMPEPPSSPAAGRAATSQPAADDIAAVDLRPWS